MGFDRIYMMGYWWDLMGQSNRASWNMDGGFCGMFEPCLMTWLPEGNPCFGWFIGYPSDTAWNQDLWFVFQRNFALTGDFIFHKNGNTHQSFGIRYPLANNRSGETSRIRWCCYLPHPSCSLPWYVTRECPCWITYSQQKEAEELWRSTRDHPSWCVQVGVYSTESLANHASSTWCRALLVSELQTALPKPCSKEA